MMPVLHLGVWMIGSFGIALAIFGQMHEKCARYCPPSKAPIVSGAKTVCVDGFDNCTYCKFYRDRCPDIPDCKNNVAPIPDWGNHCLICPDVECVYDGNLYIADEIFDSVDGVNKCICLKGGETKCEEHYLGLMFTFCS